MSAGVAAPAVSESARGFGRRKLIDFSLMSAAKIIQMVLRLVAFTFIARVLEPERYGTYVTVISFVEFFVLFTLPGITKPLVRDGCRAPDQLSAILSSRIGIRHVLSLFAVAVCLVSVVFANYPVAVKMLIVVYSTAIILEALQAYFRVAYVVFEEFRYIALLEIVQSATFVILAVGAVLAGAGVIALVFISLLALMITVTVDYLLSRRLVRFRLLGPVVLDREFLKSSVIFSMTNVFWMLVIRTDVLMVSLLATPADVGVYHVANRLIGTAMLTVDTLNRTIYPVIVKRLHGRNVDLGRYRTKAVWLGAFLAVTLPLAAWASGPVIRLVLGPEYAESADLFKVLLGYLVIQIVAAPVTLVLQAVDRERLLLLAAMPLPVIKVVANYYLYQDFGLFGIAYSTIVVYAIYLGIVLIGGRTILKERLFAG